MIDYQKIKRKFLDDFEKPTGKSVLESLTRSIGESDRRSVVSPIDMAFLVGVADAWWSDESERIPALTALTLCAIGTGQDDRRRWVYDLSVLIDRYITTSENRTRYSHDLIRSYLLAVDNARKVDHYSAIVACATIASHCPELSSDAALEAYGLDGRYP